MGDTEIQRAHEEALSLAVSLHKKHFWHVKQWEPLPDLVGLLSQIDNMTAGLIHRASIANHPDVVKLVEAAEVIVQFGFVDRKKVSDLKEALQKITGVSTTSENECDCDYETLFTSCPIHRKGTTSGEDNA